MDFDFELAVKIQFFVVSTVVGVFGLLVSIRILKAIVAEFFEGKNVRKR